MKTAVFCLSKRSRNFKKGGGAPERGGGANIAKNSLIWGLKSWILLTFYGKFGAKTIGVEGGGGGGGAIN
jgi:hypothetical protein